MKRTWLFSSLLLSFALVGCGGMKEKATANSDPCDIEFKFTSKSQNNARDLIRYDSFRHTTSCETYIGENVRTLQYRLFVKAKPSVGRLGFVVIDQGRSAELGLYSLGEGIVETTNIAQDEWVGPLNSVEHYFIVLGFPEGTEKVLYPTEVKLKITR